MLAVMDKNEGGILVGLLEIFEKIFDVYAMITVTKFFIMLTI